MGSKIRGWRRDCGEYTFIEWEKKKRKKEAEESAALPGERLVKRFRRKG